MGNVILSQPLLYLLKTYVVYSPVPNKIGGYIFKRGRGQNKSGGIEIITIKRETVIVMDDF